ncbi:MurR/RpiR family transcriptional regulator [Gemmobacter nectariphilus]|uniref:MurR/RpiR family transcriptional regulator n=1 Tax=Gemmobacter nectariphilus TaxID=220343 RepID=UPI0004038668|nr:MurR/RpiR family transcriptional regulator [Gemmobacter nectariphilus]
MAHSVRSRLAQAVTQGSKAERALASFMLGAIADLPFENAATVATRVGVSEATVGRFCRGLGYQSFRALKERLKDDIGDGPWLISDRLAEMRAAAGSDATGAAPGLELEIAGLVAVYELRRRAEWRTVVRRLAEVDRVVIAGFQTERGLAQYFANQLQYLRDGVQLADLSAGNFTEALASDRPRCLVIFEARRYSRLARLLAREARAMAVPVTLITDSYCTWTADADEVFPVPTQFSQFWDSTALMASLGNLMINDLFFELGERVEGRLARVAELYGAFTGHVGDPVVPVRK